MSQESPPVEKQADEASAQPEQAIDEPGSKCRTPLWLRLLALVLILLSLFAVGHYTGFNQSLSIEGIRQRVQDAGAYGVILLLVLFVIGLLVQVPGMVFVGVSIFVYGRLLGGGLAWFGGLLALSVSFLVVRSVGGEALAEIKSPFMKKIFARMDDYPIATVATLRIFFQFSPPLNYALALSPLKFRDYIIGSALGLMPVVVFVSLLFERFFG